MFPAPCSVLPCAAFKELWQGYINSSTHTESSDGANTAMFQHNVMDEPVRYTSNYDDDSFCNVSFNNFPKLIN